MVDQFTHRLIYLIGAGLSIDELHDKFIEDRYKRTMLGLSQKQRQEVCEHPDQHYPRFGTPLSPSARISPRSIYGVWEDPDR